MQVVGAGVWQRAVENARSPGKVWGKKMRLEGKEPKSQEHRAKWAVKYEFDKRTSANDRSASRKKRPQRGWPVCRR